ncbi:hypothetical protein [Streptomyces sp. NPDC049879]|uniref:hypothetical protein n=1 Tax=Streptomyces sp. NPDC049879 TaxID=3365598 RepID=UPI003791DB8E
MDIREVVAGLRDVVPLDGLDGAWHWSPVPGIGFAGALSEDGGRLLQMSSRGFYRHELAVAALRFAREREKEMSARNPYLGSAEGFAAPGGPPFDAVAAVAPTVHRFYRADRPELTPFVTCVFPAYSCEFSGGETQEEAVTRYRMLRPAEWERGPLPFLKMRYANTRTGSRSTNRGRGFTKPDILAHELRLLADAPGSFVEFENRHAHVWRVEWHDGAWFVAEWDTQDGTPREIGLAALLTFATARLHD